MLQTAWAVCARFDNRELFQASYGCWLSDPSAFGVLLWETAEAALKAARECGEPSAKIVRVAY